MNYQTHYNRLIDRARERILTGYTEQHHIVPKCVGGEDAPSNIVRLTAEEHYVAHQLLVKIYPGNRKIVFSAIILCGRTSKVLRNNKAFGWLRRKNAESVRGFRHTAETKAKLSDGRKGANVSQEARDKIGAAHLGWHHSEDTKRRMSATRFRIAAEKRAAMPFDPRSLLTSTEKRRLSHLGKRMSEESRARMRVASVAREAAKRARLSGGQPVEVRGG